MKGGIINIDVWNDDNAKGLNRQVLVILKEAPTGKNFNLIKHLQEGGRGNTYNNVALWLYLLRHFNRDNSDLSWKKAKSKKTPEGRKKNLIHAAVINISDTWQKSASGKRTNDSTLYANHSSQRQHEIEEFISTIKPDIILCGGKSVVDCLHKFRDKPHKSSVPNGTKFSSLYTYTINGVTFPLISMPHPNAPFLQKEMYKDLKMLLEQVKI